MRNPNSIQEIAEVHSLLTDIKKEYTEGIRGVLRKNDPELFRNDDERRKSGSVMMAMGLVGSGLGALIPGFLDEILGRSSAEVTVDEVFKTMAVCFAIEDSSYLLLGFEDLYGGGDRDYNDLLFALDIGTMNVNELIETAALVPEAEEVLLLVIFTMFLIKYLKDTQILNTKKVNS